jgi:(p)ppGpp synthase/HD superfamily hydrolase
MENEKPSDPSNSAMPGKRFQEALVYASRLHAGQTRKGTQIPYISHLLAVAAIVLEEGGDEDQAIAALLHDAVEDQGGRETLYAIRSRFGEKVADLVDKLTDAYEIPKPPWRERKERYLNHLITAPPEVLRISLADKLHNARSTLADLRRDGPATWERFRGGKDGSLWYYQSLVEFFEEGAPGSLTWELARVVEEIRHLTEPES